MLRPGEEAWGPTLLLSTLLPWDRVSSWCSSCVHSSHFLTVLGWQAWDAMPNFYWGSEHRFSCLYSKHCYPRNHFLAHEKLFDSKIFIIVSVWESICTNCSWCFRTKTIKFYYKNIISKVMKQIGTKEEEIWNLSVRVYPEATATFRFSRPSRGTHGGYCPSLTSHTPKPQHKANGENPWPFKLQIFWKKI